MTDMLVKLYDLPKTSIFSKMEAADITIRPAIAPEKHHVSAWVERQFDLGWRSEVEVAFARQPVSVYIAIKAGKLVGFACYDATIRGFFGPTGVDKTQRGQGIGEALLFACLKNMREIGYAYAIIGSAGPTEFYHKKVGAVAIENSDPGIYKGTLEN